MGNKCWNCARLAKCKKLKPCEKFIQFRDFISKKDVARLCHVSSETIHRRLRRNTPKALKWIEEVSGFTFVRRDYGDGREVFVLEPNNSENSVKLSLALQELESEVKE